MNIKNFLISLLLILTNLISSQTINYVDKVNPFIDTDSPRYFFFNSASRPFGMVNLSPDTQPTGWMSGYLYKKDSISCFSHIHSWQMWGIPVLPTSGKFKGNLGMKAYRSHFSHINEIAKPGYHKVFLDDYNITAELTSTERAGFHRYTFQEGNENSIIFDTGAPLADGETSYSEIWKISKSALAGYQIIAATERRPKEIPVFFYAEINKPFQKLITWKDGIIEKGTNGRISGKNIGAAISFSTSKNEIVMMKVGISYVSVEQAKLNLDAEISHWDFDKTKEESFNQWNSLLGRIKVEGGSEKQQIKFYTDLWHSLLGRRILSDVNGMYMDMTGDYPRIKQVRLNNEGKPLFPQYNFDAWWGSQWSLNILWPLVYPEIVDGFCNTMVEMYKNGGLIPRGPSGGNYTFVMIGDPSTPFFASAYNKGIRNYDINIAYEGLRKNAFEGGSRDHAGYQHEKDAKGGGMKDYLQKGYVPMDRDNIAGRHRAACVSMTMDYAYQDWALGQIAKSLGNQSDYELFENRSKNYKNVFNPLTGYMQPRLKNGEFSTKFNPMQTEGYCETSAAINTYFVPHDINGLSQLLGGNYKMAERLNKQFEIGQKYNFAYNSNKSDGYWLDYSNQPGTGMAHIFNSIGYPWLTQKWSRLVKEQTEIITPEGGYLGDEDEGQMGALGTLLAIGVFDFSGGAGINPGYEIASPIFDKITIELNKNYYSGDNFVIETKNNSPKNYYIDNAELNDKPLNSYKISHETLTKGGTLKLLMSNKPNKNWGTK